MIGSVCGRPSGSKKDGTWDSIIVKEVIMTIAITTKRMMDIHA